MCPFPLTLHVGLTTVQRYRTVCDIMLLYELFLYAVSMPERFLRHRVYAQYSYCRPIALSAHAPLTC